MTRFVQTLAVAGLICGIAFAAPAQAHGRHHESGRDAAYMAVSPDTRAPAAAFYRGTPAPYEDETHGTATGGPSGGLPGGS